MLNLNSIKLLTKLFCGDILNTDSMKNNSTKQKIDLQMEENKMSSMNKREKVVVIGGGIAGLSAGIYALRAGFDAEIYEKNAIPG